MCFLHTCDLALVCHQPLFDLSPIIGNVCLDQCANTNVAGLVHLQLEVLNTCKEPNRVLFFSLQAFGNPVCHPVPKGIGFQV